MHIAAKSFATAAVKSLSEALLSDSLVLVLHLLRRAADLSA